MLENLKCFIYGSLIGMGVASVIVATNDKIKNKIAESVVKAKEEATKLKKQACDKIKNNKTENSKEKS